MMSTAKDLYKDNAEDHYDSADLVDNSSHELLRPTTEATSLRDNWSLLGLAPLPLLFQVLGGH